MYRRSGSCATCHTRRSPAAPKRCLTNAVAPYLSSASAAKHTADRRRLRSAEAMHCSIRWVDTPPTAAPPRRRHALPRRCGSCGEGLAAFPAVDERAAKYDTPSAVRAACAEVSYRGGHAGHARGVGVRCGQAVLLSDGAAPAAAAAGEALEKVDTSRPSGTSSRHSK